MTDSRQEFVINIVPGDHGKWWWAFKRIDMLIAIRAANKPVDSATLAAKAAADEFSKWWNG